MVDLARIPPKVALINRDSRLDYSAGPKIHLAPRALSCGEEYLMLKGLFAALLIVTASGTFPVQAQVAGSGAADAGSRERNPRLLNENYLAPTGETVPHPGASQGAATMDLDRRIEQKNNLLDQSICSNCN